MKINPEPEGALLPLLPLLPELPLHVWVPDVGCTPTMEDSGLPYLDNRSLYQYGDTVGDRITEAKALRLGTYYAECS